MTIATTIGCDCSSPEKYSVQGVVTYDGAAVPTGLVTFVPNRTGPRVSGAIGSDGRYQVTAPAGAYKIAVIAIEETVAPSVTEENWKDSFASVNPRRYVPEIYADAETSGLTCTVEAASDNTYDISIASRARGRR